jgi:hypothetical protein
LKHMGSNKLHQNQHLLKLVFVLDNILHQLNKEDNKIDVTLTSKGILVMDRTLNANMVTTLAVASDHNMDQDIN